MTSAPSNWGIDGNLWCKSGLYEGYFEVSPLNIAVIRVCCTVSCRVMLSRRIHTVAKNTGTLSVPTKSLYVTAGSFQWDRSFKWFTKLNCRRRALCCACASNHTSGETRAFCRKCEISTISTCRILGLVIFSYPPL